VIEVPGLAVAAGLIQAVQVYILAGTVVAAAFLLWGVDRIDEAARGSYLFRIVVAPGVIGLWPVVLWRWIALERARAAPGRP
jgi:hypothetical protein